MPFPLSRSVTMATMTLRRTCPPRTRIASVRQHKQDLHNSRVLFARKGAEDKDSLKPEPAEYGKSGSDSAAAQSDTAFDPNETRPEQEEDGGKETNSGSLDMSPGNIDASKPREAGEGGADKAPEQNRERTSGGGSPKKSGKGPA